MSPSKELFGLKDALFDYYCKNSTDYDNDETAKKSLINDIKEIDKELNIPEIDENFYSIILKNYCKVNKAKGGKRVKKSAKKTAKKNCKKNCKKSCKKAAKKSKKAAKKTARRRK
jgi:hypothetical protein